MTRRRRSTLGEVQRDAYLFSRTVGDVQAARKGRLPKRVIKRVYHRKVIGVLRRLGLW